MGGDTSSTASNSTCMWLKNVSQWWTADQPFCVKYCACWLIFLFSQVAETQIFVAAVGRFLRLPQPNGCRG